MKLRKALALGALAALAAPVVLLARQNILLNGSMESGQGPSAPDPRIPAGWTLFGVNVERNESYNLVPPGGGYALKAFGDGNNTSAGASQIVLGITPGQSVAASVSLFTPGNDKLGGTGQAGLVFEFLSQFGGTLFIQQIYPLDAGSPGDTWMPVTLGPYTAPANTTQMRVTCRLQWSGAITGAAYWDGAAVTVNGGTNQLVNGDFETAGHGTGQSPIGIDDWNGFSDQEKSNDVALDGSASLKVGTHAQYSGLYQNMIALNDGDHLLLRAFAWNPSSDPMVANTRAGIKLEFSANGNVPPPVQNLAFDANQPPDTWVRVDISSAVPPLATSARVVCIFVGDSSTTGAVYFDDSFAERSSQPGSNQLQNASFELGSGGANGITDWTEFNGGGTSVCQKDCFDLPVYHDGDCAARATGTTVSGVTQTFAVTTGETVSFHAWLLTPTFERLTGTGVAGVKIEWVLGSVPPPVDIGAPGTPNTIGAGFPTNTWLPLNIDYTMPAGTNAITRFVDIVATGSAITGHVYFDSCEAVATNLFNGIDWNTDNAEDLLDFAQLQYVYGVVPFRWGGLTFDSNDDGVVDWTDYQYFAPRFTGPNP